MMTIQITATNIRYADGRVAAVQVHFTGRDEDQTINLNGYIPFTEAEYEGNEGMKKLVELVKGKLVQKIKGETAPQPEPEQTEEDPVQAPEAE